MEGSQSAGHLVVGVAKGGTVQCEEQESGAEYFLRGVLGKYRWRSTAIYLSAVPLPG